ncbi:MAG: 2-oxo-4-hydroxy-4-carboxy-5-ureidoimidazoline decarboxylase [Alphaproteobacteria bacterium]|nr:MAG: 2-oxo-4-hydroxy-4-carboxy-5-ureidoimidazoline decarboxylase [Alphaproteobacteria bacterium]
MSKVALADLNAADDAGFMAALGDVYEHAPWVAQAASRQRPFVTLTALHNAMMAAVRAAPADQQVALIKGHPDLAGKAARAGAMTVDSKAEQASAGLDRLSETEFAQFHRLNNAYREKFGIPFIICARRHSKDSILQQFERRLQNSAAAETDTALGEIFRIAALRLDQRLEAADRLDVHGRLSTHVLDTHSGRPAAGVAIELLELSVSGEPRVIARGMSNRDGRTDAPLIRERPLPIGRYELRFHVGDYFARLKARQDDPPFLDVVPVRFAIAEPEGHYHVPLLVTPWSYSTYRGS